MSETLVRTVSLRKVYENGNVEALRGVNFEARRGEFVAIMGPSGSGKTTMLNIVGALDYPSSGEVWINSTQISDHTNLDIVRRTQVGFIFQLHNLIPVLTAIENVEIPMYALCLSKGERRKRAIELLDLCKVGHRSHARAIHLSGGERQRVAVARALANDAQVILADEPTGNLDSKTGMDIIRLLIELKSARNKTLIIVTHNPEIAKLADRICEMRDGLLTVVESAAKQKST